MKLGEFNEMLPEYPAEFAQRWIVEAGIRAFVGANRFHRLNGETARIRHDFRARVASEECVVHISEAHPGLETWLKSHVQPPLEGVKAGELAPFQGVE
jgi:hypothetical protein